MYCFGQVFYWSDVTYVIHTVFVTISYEASKTFYRKIPRFSGCTAKAKKFLRNEFCLFWDKSRIESLVLIVLNPMDLFYHFWDHITFNIANTEKTTKKRQSHVVYYLLVGVVWGIHKMKSWIKKIKYVEQIKSKQKLGNRCWKVKFRQRFFYSVR